MRFWSPPPTISTLASSSAGSSVSARSSTSICFSPVTRPTKRMRFSVRGVPARRVLVRVDAARDGVHADQAGVLLEELRSLARRRRHRFGTTERASRRLPGEADRPVLPCLRQQRELEHVLGHEVVGADDADAALLGLDREAAPGDDVRLEVHHVGLHLVDDPRAVLPDAPRQCESQPVVRVPAPAVEPVRGDLLALVDLLPRAVLAVRGGRHDVHLVAALDESRGEALGESGCAVHVGSEGVGADQDAQRAFRLGVAGAGGGTRTGGVRHVALFLTVRGRDGQSRRARRRADGRSPASSDDSLRSARQCLPDVHVAGRDRLAIESSLRGGSAGGSSRAGTRPRPRSRPRSRTPRSPRAAPARPRRAPRCRSRPRRAGRRR